MCVCGGGGGGYGRAEESRRGQKERGNKGIAIWEGAEGERREGVGIRRKERRRGEVEETGECRLEGGPRCLLIGVIGESIMFSDK